LPCEATGSGEISLLTKKEIILGGLYSALIFAGILAIAGFYKKNMNVLQIIKHPDPTLRQISEPITYIDEPVISLAEDIIATLRYQALLDFFFREISAERTGCAAGRHSKKACCLRHKRQDKSHDKS